MNNIKSPNIVIPKCPKIEKVGDNTKNYIYSINIASQNWKKNLETKKL